MSRGELATPILLEGLASAAHHRIVEWESNGFLRAIWAGKLWIAAGGFARDSTIKLMSRGS